MKNKKFLLSAPLFVSTLIVIQACATNTPRLQQVATASGPAIINPHANAQVIEASPDLKLAQVPDIETDVKDTGANVKAVQLKITLAQPIEGNPGYLEAPFVVPMTHLGGTTWGVSFSSDDLKKLAVNGQDMAYKGQIIAQDDKGAVSTSGDVVSFTVKTPPA